MIKLLSASLETRPYIYVTDYFKNVCVYAFVHACVRVCMCACASVRLCLIICIRAFSITLS